MKLKVIDKKYVSNFIVKDDTDPEKGPGRCRSPSLGIGKVKIKKKVKK